MAQAVADAIGASKRQVQLWTDAGALLCVAETNRQGRGRQRLYEPAELPVAKLVAAMARFKVPIGTLILWSRMIRSSLGHVPISPKDEYTPEWYRAALEGKVQSYLTLRIDHGVESVSWTNQKHMLEQLEISPGAIVIHVKNVVTR